VKPPGWSPWQRRLHWWVAGLLVLTAGLAIAMVNLPMSQLLAKFLAYQLHKSFGMLVLGLVLVRLALRALRPAPELTGLTPAMRRLARWGQGGLYGLLVLVPMLGWLAGQAAAGPVPTTLFLVIPLPHVLDPDPALYTWLRPLHQLCAYGLLALGAVHALLALKHHREGLPVLARMMGGGFSTGAPPPSAQ
jgi:cytochrome b561